MTTLSKKDILDAIKKGSISFNPELDKYQIQPNSIDIRLGNVFYVPKTWEYDEKGRHALIVDHLDLKDKKENFKILNLKPGQYFEILPNEFIIVSTAEEINLKAPDIMAVMYARSSVIRRGLIIESGVVDVGYCGYLVIPIVNNTNGQIIRLYPGERICQLVFHSLSGGISDEEAQKHGMLCAKYEGSTVYNLESRSDSSEETRLIKDGKIKELKEKYKLDDF